MNITSGIISDDSDYGTKLKLSDSHAMSRKRTGLAVKTMTSDVSLTMGEESAPELINPRYFTQPTQITPNNKNKSSTKVHRLIVRDVPGKKLTNLGGVGSSNSLDKFMNEFNR